MEAAGPLVGLKFRAGAKISPGPIRRETTLRREIAVKNVSLGIFDPARCRRNPDFFGWFSAKTPLGFKE
jgi:hypothetical protein